MRFINLLFLAFFLSSPAFAGNLEDAHAALDRQDYQTALGLLLPLANQGNGAAQELLGQMYYDGFGVKKDDAEAMKWYTAAANSYHISPAEGGVYGRRKVYWITHKGPHDDQILKKLPEIDDKFPAAKPAGEMWVSDVATYPYFNVKVDGISYEIAINYNFYSSFGVVVKILKCLF